MASQLEDKVQYGLLSSGFSGADKTILQFKLTDSSLKSIEEYLSAKANCNKRPRIHFEGNLGVITVPWYDETSKKTRKNEYKFTVQPIQAPEKSSLECIQQFRNKRGSEQLDSIGAIQTRINIQATDDVYKKTQERMKQADENLKRVSTQEVSQKNLNPGKKVKINSQTPYAIKAMSASSTRPTPPAPSSATSRTPGVISTSSQVSKPRAIPPPSKSSAKPSATFASTLKPMQPKLSSSNSNTSRKSAVYNKPCRERIIHLLALKPYKKPEMVYRLRSDGISEKERNKIAATLQEVATMTKDNTYILNKSLYSQVREDWPQYTDEDRKNVKRRIEQLRTTKESPVRSQPSPLPARVDIDANTVKRKRIILPEVTDYTAPKKPRIAHNRSHQIQEGKNSPSDSHSQPPTPQGVTYKPPTPQGATYKPPTPQGGYKPPTPQGGSYHPSVSSPSISTTKCSPDSSYSSDPTPAAKAIPKNAREIREEEERYSTHIVGKENNHHHNHHHHHHQENHSPAGQVSSSAPDYIMEFPPVTSKEQRSRYKEQFYKEYPEYERLCKDIMRVTELFTDLKNRLAKAEVGSKKHDQIKEEIIAENKNVQKRNDFKSMNVRFKYLHEKLAHVKQMIANYDEGSCS